MGLNPGRAARGRNRKPVGIALKADCRAAAVVLFDSDSPGEAMPNDPLPAPNDAAVPPGDADYEALYAEIAVTPRGRGFLIEHANRNRNPDAQALVATIARLETLVRGHLPAHVAAALHADLVEIAATLAQIETVLAAGAGAASDAHFAVERVHDIAMALRQREVDAALCDALESAAREVGDAIVRSDAAAGRAQSALALLRDLAQRVKDMMTRVSAIGAIPGAPPAADELREPEPDDAHAAADRAQSASGESDLSADQTMDRPEPERFHDTAPYVSATPDQLAPRKADDEGLRAELPDPQAAAQPYESPDSPSQRDLLPPLPSPIDRASVEPSASGGETATNAAAAARAVSNDPLAAVRSLSEEELIALFS